MINVLQPYSSDVAWHSRSIMFYTYRPDYSFIRNAGFAHEPGAFAVFNVYGIIINYLRGIQLISKRNIVYYAALITTFSTAGYISIFVLLLLLVKNKRYKLISTIILILLIPVAVNFYLTSPFMQQKIEQQFEIASKQSLTERTTGRFYGFRKSLYVLQLYPFYGRGLLSMTAPESNYSPEDAGYGWISYISKLGWVFGCLFLFFYLKGIFNITKLAGYDKFAFFLITLSIFINLSAQDFLTNPFFLIFLFLGIYNYKNYTTIKTNNINQYKKHWIFHPGLKT